VIDELLAGARTEEEIVGPGGVLAQLTKRLVERAMSAEPTEHLGYEPRQEPPGGTGNTPNGSTPKTLATQHRPVRIKRRGSQGQLRAQIVRKGSGASRGSTTRSSRSTRAACRGATSRRTWPRSTGCRSVAI
jgi:putative transposase